MTSDDALLDLATEMRDTTGRHQVWLHDHGQMLSELMPNNELLTWLVAEMREHVNMLLAEQPEEAKYPAINWATCPAEDAEKLWDALGAWVRDILVARFHPNRRELVDCWALHVGAVENLLWLKRYWHLMQAPRAVPSMAAEWYTRWRADAMREIGDAIMREASTLTPTVERCSPGMHLGKPLPGARQAPPLAPQQGTPLQPPSLQGAATYPPVPLGQPQYPAPPLPAPGTAYAPLTPMTGAVQVDDPASELAKPEYWWPHFEHARRLDIGQRRAREEAAAKAKAAAEAEAADRLAARYEDEVGADPND
ncbi:hypothetical protein [Amycolatopsis sp. NPDC059657]|uniref:hypothetical protein n=1 Tax=Amycolatopsis sp. NPDC059657 TaxID=3346899 RepID=UPI00366D3CB2